MPNYAIQNVIEAQYPAHHTKRQAELTELQELKEKARQYELSTRWASINNSIHNTIRVHVLLEFEELANVTQHARVDWFFFSLTSCFFLCADDDQHEMGATCCTSAKHRRASLLHQQMFIPACICRQIRISSNATDQRIAHLGTAESKAQTVPLTSTLLRTAHSTSVSVSAHC